MNTEQKQSSVNQIVDDIYSSYGSDSGVLFGIKERDVVKAIVEFTINRIPSEQSSVSGLKWVKASERLPKEHGYYFCKIGKLRDRILWPKNKIVLMFNRPGIDIEWLEETPLGEIDNVGSEITKQDIINAWNSAYGGDGFHSGEDYVASLHIPDKASVASHSSTSTNLLDK